MPSKTRPTIRLIGLGNIGFRHLQGLKPLAGSIRLEGRDINAEAIARAKHEWFAQPVADGDFGPSHADEAAADMTVLATSAIGREALMEQEIVRGTRRLLLEKVVFTDATAFARAQTALDSAEAVAHVNTARRLWPLHQGLAAMARQGAEPVHISVAGRALGFACNGVHFIDLLQMISGEDDVRVVDADISEPWAGKREGYYEVWGRARLQTPEGSTLTLTVLPDSPESHEVTMELGGRTLRVDEGAGLVSDSSGAEVGAFGRSPFQSELSKTYAEPMLAGRPPALPSLATSAKAHLALFDVVAPSFEKAGLIGEQGLPIT